MEVEEQRKFQPYTLVVLVRRSLSVNILSSNNCGILSKFRNLLILKVGGLSKQHLFFPNFIHAIFDLPLLYFELLGTFKDLRSGYWSQ